MNTLHLHEKSDSLLNNFECFNLSKMEHFNYVGQRADKFKVTGITETGYKEVDHYTVTCPECGGDGRYDELGDIICEDCSVVISGPNSPMVVSTNDASQGVSESEEYQKYWKLEDQQRTVRGVGGAIP